MTANINSQKLALLKNISIKSSQNESFIDQQTDKIAGFLQNGKFSWISIDAIIRIVSTETGVEIAYYNFAKHHGIEGCIINHVEEVSYLSGICMLAVSIEFTNSSARAGMVSIFCVQGCKVLGSMDMSERITCCKYISNDACRRSVLRQFHGTLAIGTDQGKLFLVDLMIPKDIKDIILSPSYDAEIFPLINVPADLEQIQITQHHRKIVNNRESGEKCFFSIQLKQVLEETGSIISMLCMPNLFMMAVGLDDGRMILYDLIDLQAFHLAYPPGNRAPLTHMSYIEPTDDPRSAVYIWTFHSSKDGAIAVMHSIMFDNKNNEFYENFRSCSVRLTMPIFVKNTFPICCRSITKSLTQDEEDILTINLLAWTSPTTNQTHIMIFDLNQWYKEEMPSVGDWRNKLKYTVVFELPNVSLDVVLNEKSLLPFISITRPEEHFYPNSLSFDLAVLEPDKFSLYRWNGVQNLVLQQFNSVGPQMILEPSYYFNELLQVAITPQFYDVNFSIATPMNLKRDFLLSIALEYNFTGFLKKCAWAWADGSYLGKDGNVGVGLSTLTEWIWNRVRAIKDICNNMCQPLFDYSEQRIDCGTQKQLSLCCKQLKVLSELLQMIAKDYQKFIPENIQSQIQTQANTVKMASDYQEVLQWLLNVGLLPEGHYNQNRGADDENDFVIVPYPYRTIQSHYESQRAKLSHNDDLSEEEKPAKYLFIDAFIENECFGYDMLDWGCLYPPKSIQSLLRSLLVPDIPIENKHVIFIYLFMDITNVLNDSSYSNIVRNLIKFPAVFKMNPSVIKRTQAFWNLDNGQLETAVEELISPLSQDRYLPKWQRELLIGALLKQNANSLSLRALRCPGNPISSELEVTTLLANNLISEALKIQRASGNRELLEKLFHKILHSSNYEQLLDLALTEDEGKVLRDYLQNADLSNCVNLHFVYLLQRSKFIDAAQLMDSFSSTSNINLEPPKQVLNAYYSTMEPTTRKLTSMVYADNQIKIKEIPLPLSVNLIKSRCNASNDIYKKCVQSITEATYDSTQDIKEMPFIGTPKLGIFEYKQPIVQMQEVNYPTEFNEHGKRPKNDNNNGIFKMEDFEGPKTKRRRLDDASSAKKYTSYVDKRISLLTNFRNKRPKLNFTSRTPSSSSRASPERVALFGDLLRTPVIEKRTPQKIIPDRAATPHSILKTRSCRSSISPTQSRFSEFDDNKSVKSITFAALPGTNESSLQDSSYLDESFSGEQQLESSAEYYSPEKSPRIVPIISTTSIPSPEVKSSNSDIIAISSSSSGILSGPKPRPPLRSRSTTPKEDNLSQEKKDTQENKNADIELINADKKMHDDTVVDNIEPSQITAQSTGILEPEKMADTVIMNDTSSEIESFNRKSVLKSDDEYVESDSSIPDESIYRYVRKSVLPDNYGDELATSSDESDMEPPNESILKSSDESDESENDIAEDEHFEEEELPEHSDYNDDEIGDSDSFEYGNIDLDDSDSNSGSDNSAPQRFVPNEIIEIEDSDSDSEVQIKTAPQAIPVTSNDNIQKQPEAENVMPIEATDEQPKAENVMPIENTDEQSNEERRELLELATAEINDEECPASSQEQMIDILYEDIQEENDQEINENIESPQFEEISSQKSHSELEIIDENKNPETIENIDDSEDIDNEQQIIETDAIDDIQLIEEPILDIETEGINKTLIQNEVIEQPSQNEAIEREIAPQTESSVDIETIEINKMEEEHNIQIKEDELRKDQPLEETVEIKPNVSEMSADCSFASAQNELNEAVIIELTTNDTVINEEDVPDESNILDKAVAADDGEQTEMSINEQDDISNIQEQEDTNILEIAQIESTNDDISEKMTTADEIVGDIDPHFTVEGSETKENVLDIAQINTSENITEESNVATASQDESNILEVARIEENTQLENTAIEDEEPIKNTQKSDVKSQQDENDKEIEDIMGGNKSPQPIQNIPVDLSTPKRRSSRAKSEVNEMENARIKRGVSVPSSGTSSPISRSSRASSEHRVNPKVLLKEKMLERIEESPSGVLTRNKSRLLLQEQSRESTPQSRAVSEDPSESSVKRTPRRRSTSGTPTTPRRIFTRAASRESFAGDTGAVTSTQNDEKTPEDNDTKRRGRKKTASVASDDEQDDTKSTRSTRSTSSKKKDIQSFSSTKISPVQSTSPMDEISVSNRRLTRSQLTVLEKSRLLAEKISNEAKESSSSTKLRATKSDMGKANYEDDSDNDSVKSDSTTSRTSRKRKMPIRKAQDSETSSIASKSSRKSKSPHKKNLLSVIHEEGDSEVSEKSTSERKKKGKK